MSHSTHQHSHHSLPNPGRFQISSQFKCFLMVLTLIGTATLGAGLVFDPKRTWAGFILNHFYFMSLALGGVFFAALQWATGAMWSAPVRRLSESFSAYLPVLFLTFGVLILGIPHLYLWSHPEHVQGDLVLLGKSGYLSTGFFVIRNFLAIGIWIFFAKMLVKNSTAQDQTRSIALTFKNQKWSPAFLAFFAVTFTMASFDQIMSLDPHWFSTLFGVYCFAGLIYATLPAVCLLAIYLKSRGKLADFLNDNHFHDLGKFMFAFTVFWAYIGFSQFMLIWYANLPEETGYYIHRLHGGWFGVSVFLLIGKFFVPFCLLLPRAAKRNLRTLTGVGVFMLIAQWVDVLWMVQPEFYSEGPVLGWTELGLTLGFIGLFGLSVARFLSRYTVVAIGDPRLEESVFHHHQ